jgi:hypothetical protein
MTDAIQLRATTLGFSRQFTPVSLPLDLIGPDPSKISPRSLGFPISYVHAAANRDTPGDPPGSIVVDVGVSPAADITIHAYVSFFVVPAPARP